MNNILDQFDDNDKKVELWKLFIGPYADYYSREWRQLQKGRVLSFNLSAFCFGVFWLLYRKMYKPAIILLSVYFAEGYLESLLLTNLPFSVGTWEFIRIGFYFTILGFLGNWIYYRYTEQELAKIADKYPEHLQFKLIQKKGGTSFLPIIIVILFILFIFFIKGYII